jgi:hypothetical protein
MRHWFRKFVLYLTLVYAYAWLLDAYILIYSLSYFYAVETTMTWYVVFYGWKSEVYELLGVYSEYVLGFSGAAYQSYSTWMQAEEDYVTLLSSEQRLKGRRCHMESRTCPKHVVLERLGDISAVCSHCCLMVQVHVTYMFVALEVWTKI